MNSTFDLNKAAKSFLALETKLHTEPIVDENCVRPHPASVVALRLETLRRESFRTGEQVALYINEYIVRLIEQWVNDEDYQIGSCAVSIYLSVPFEASEGNEYTIRVDHPRIADSVATYACLQPEVEWVKVVAMHKKRQRRVQQEREVFKKSLDAVVSRLIEPDETVIILAQGVVETNPRVKRPCKRVSWNENAQ